MIDGVRLGDAGILIAGDGGAGFVELALEFFDEGHAAFLRLLVTGIPRKYGTPSCM